MKLNYGEAHFVHLFTLHSAHLQLFLSCEINQLLLYSTLDVLQFVHFRREFS